MHHFWKSQILITSFLAVSTFALSNEPISPIPDNIEVDVNKAKFGEQLFFDTRLSADNTISCATCHDITSKGFGAESTAVSTGINNQKGDRNSPTVYNAVLNFAQFWDGRAANLQHQAEGPVTNPIEMGMVDWDAAIDNINDDATYIDQAKTLYSSELTAEVVTHAIAEYEKTLITLNAPFDQYLKGDESAITDEQKKGYKLFKAYGCVSCHQGTNVGGNMFQKFGVLKDITLQPGSLSKDLGRYNVTKNEWDKRVFKVPSLRLVTKTAPYFHDGSVATIDEAVDIMIQFQLGRQVPQSDRQAIIEFLKSLVGELPKGIN